MSHYYPRDRRSFLIESGSAAAIAFAAPTIVSAATRQKQLHVGCVGVSARGLADLLEIGSHQAVRFVGFCDIDKNRFDKADKAFPGVQHFEDYRIMFSELGDRLDAVVVATPDHMHAPISMMAMHMGKHVFCQKPLTHTVWESRQMRLLADKRKLVTQMGNQIHSDSRYQLAIRLIHDGAIGKVREVHSWVGVQGRQYCQRTDRPSPSPVPENVNWDLWVGAAQMRPYAPEVYHPFKWRDWQAFGSGALGDFGCHLLDPVFGALELTAPLSVIAQHDGTNDEVWPGPETVTYTFPGTRRTAHDTIRIVWRDGGLTPPSELPQLPAGKTLPKSGSLFVGEGGVMLLPHVGAPVLYPQEKFERFPMPQVPGLKHWHSWIDGILDGKKTTDGFDFAGPVAETVQLGNVATRMPNKLLDWDARQFRFSNLQEANPLLTKEYRSGFQIQPVDALAAEGC